MMHEWDDLHPDDPFIDDEWICRRCGTTKWKRDSPPRADYMVPLWRGKRLITYSCDELIARQVTED